MLRAAVRQANVQELRRLLADPAVASAVDRAALHDALRAAHDVDGPDKASCTQCFKLLLEAAPGAAAARGWRDKTLLHNAAELGLLDAAELLLERAPQAAAAVAVDSDGNTALHSAIWGLHSVGYNVDESWRDGSMADTLLLMHRLLRAAPSVLSMRTGYGKTPADLAYSLIRHDAENVERLEQRSFDGDRSQSQQLVCNAALGAARTLLAAHSRGEAGARPLLLSLKEVQEVTEVETWIKYKSHKHRFGCVRRIREDKVVTTDKTITAVPVFAKVAARLALTPHEWALVPRGDPFLHRALPAVLGRSLEEARLLLARLPQGTRARLRAALLAFHRLPEQLPQQLVFQILAGVLRTAGYTSDADSDADSDGDGDGDGGDESDESDSESDGESDSDSVID
ncbi:hypothetical protein COHA_005108 [Chlorella ohadii]|uniref:Uncharacterized protein n=1 Tax=Chlorella ohadii TaxID=2649997 RepID=A0AAD5DRD7_9CHLO|nr:hypothetical protein COHA_005108 [Chlorella ohadii]